MTILLAMAVMAAGAPPIPTSLDAVPVIENWSGRRISPKWSFDAQRAYRRGKCTSAIPYEGGSLLEVDVLFLLSGEGKAQQIVPVNSGCPGVDELIGKKIKTLLGNSFPASGSAEPRWMRSQVRFLWSE